jgi:predicted nucleic acid-binding protein
VSAKRTVIDASVALKWRLRDEEATQQADALLEDFLAGKLELLTPTLFDYEIANALRVAVTRQRLSGQDAVMALADFAQYALSGATSQASPAAPSICLVSISVQHTTVPIWRWPKRKVCGFSLEIRNCPQIT